MFEQIEKSIARFISLNREEMAAFTNKLNHKQLDKKQYLIRDGQVCKEIYFINSGCLRYFYLVDGEEKTTQFFFENSWYTDYGSFLSGKPTDHFAETLEPTELLSIDKQDLEQLYTEVPRFEKYGRLMAENAYLGLRHRTKSLTNLSAAERYLNLIHERPRIFERIPQHYIASYLDMKPQSLSRIRKTISGNIKK